MSTALVGSSACGRVEATPRGGSARYSMAVGIREASGGACIPYLVDLADATSPRLQRLSAPAGLPTSSSGFSPNTFAWSPDATSLIISDHSTAYFYRTVSGKIVGPVELGEGGGQWSPDSKRAVLTHKGHDDALDYVWFDEGAPTAPVNIQQDYESPLSAFGLVAFAPDSSKLAFAVESGLYLVHTPGPAPQAPTLLHAIDNILRYVPFHGMSRLGGVVWSADSQRLYDVADTSTGCYEAICMINASTTSPGAPVSLTGDILVRFYDAGGAMVWFHPRALSVVFKGTPAGGTAASLYAIRLTGASPSLPVKIGESSSFGGQFAPKSNRIVVRDPSGVCRLIDLDTNESTELREWRERSRSVGRRMKLGSLYTTAQA